MATGTTRYPPPVRWIGAEHLHREFQGAGAVIAIAAPPAAWLTSWPGLPDISSVQLVYVAGDGTPAVDRGLTKRTYAPATDAVVVLGAPTCRTRPLRWTSQKGWPTAWPSRPGAQHLQSQPWAPPA